MLPMESLKSESSREPLRSLKIMGTRMIKEKVDIGFNVVYLSCKTNL